MLQKYNFFWTYKQKRLIFIEKKLACLTTGKP